MVDFIFITMVALIPVFALIDVVRNDFTNNNKLIWVLVIAIFNVLGGILYYIFGQQQKLERSTS
ncbi:MAG: PLD nuclease N-terminal domain-containing protein [Bacteroidota bacterium]